MIHFHLREHIRKLRNLDNFKSHIYAFREMFMKKDDLDSNIKKFYLSPRESKERGFFEITGLASEYVEVVENYIEYYHMKAQRNRALYYLINGLRILSVGIIPVIQATKWGQSMPAVATFASFICLSMESMLSLTKCKNKWINYRTHCNMLLEACRSFGTDQMGMPPKKAAFEQFQAAVEAIISDEGAKWEKTTRKKMKLKRQKEEKP